MKIKVWKWHIWNGECVISNMQVIKRDNVGFDNGKNAKLKMEMWLHEISRIVLGHINWWFWLKFDWNQIKYDKIKLKC